MCGLFCGLLALGSPRPETLPAHRVHGETGSIPVQGAAKLLQLVVNPVTFPGSGQTGPEALRSGLEGEMRWWTGGNGDHSSL